MQLKKTNLLILLYQQDGEKTRKNLKCSIVSEAIGTGGAYNGTTATSARAFSDSMPEK